MTPYGVGDLSRHDGSGSRLLPDGTIPLPEPMLTYNQRGPLVFIHETSFHKSLNVILCIIKANITPCYRLFLPWHANYLLGQITYLRMHHVYIPIGCWQHTWCCKSFERWKPEQTSIMQYTLKHNIHYKSFIGRWHKKAVSELQYHK